MDATARPTVWIAEADPGARRAIVEVCAALDCQPEPLASLSALHEAFDPWRWGCIVMAGPMPQDDQLELLRPVLAISQGVPVIVVSDSDAARPAIEAMRLGAFDYLLKPFDADRLAEALHAAVRFDRRRRAYQQQIFDARQRIDRLTRREREVMGCVVRGMSNKMIAAELHIAQKTAENCRARLMKKLNVHNAVEVVWLALLAELDIPNAGSGELPLAYEHWVEQVCAMSGELFDDGPPPWLRRDIERERGDAPGGHALGDDET